MCLQLLCLKQLQIQPCSKDSHSHYPLEAWGHPTIQQTLVGQKEMASLLTTYSIERLTKLPSCPGSCNKNHWTQMAFLRFPQTCWRQHVSVLLTYCPTHWPQAREPSNHISAYPGDTGTRKVDLCWKLSERNMQPFPKLLPRTWAER